MKKDKGFTIVELAIVICVFAVTVAILAPVVRLTKERANRINCANNLRLISLALHMYASDHHDEFPPDLGALYPNYVKSEKTFDCPSSRHVGTPANPDYVYVTAFKESSPDSAVITYDADSNHGAKGRNVLRINGAVEWVGSSAGRPK